MAGQFIASIFGPLIYNLAAKFVAVWFAPKDRGIANTVLSVQAGMALAPLLLPMLAPTIQDVPKMVGKYHSCKCVCVLNLCNNHSSSL